MIDPRHLKIDRQFMPRYEEIELRGQRYQLIIKKYRGTWFSQFKFVYQLCLFQNQQLVTELLTNGFVVKRHRGYLSLAGTTEPPFRNQGVITSLIQHSISFFRTEGFMGFQVSIDKRNCASLAAANKIGFLEEPIPHEQFLNYILRF